MSQLRKQFGNIHSTHQKLGSSPLILWLLGLLSLILWAASSIVQIQTSEFLVLGTGARVAGVSWSIITQPWLMLTGQAPIAYVTAWLYAWIVELITLVFAMALAAAISKISSMNAFMGRWFVLFGAVLILLNGWADYTSSPGTNPLVQFLIALAIGVCVTVCLPMGVGLIEKGFEEL